MKKLYAILFTLLLFISSLHAFTVPTSRGDVELAIPDGLTLEEAYVEMARLYLEERWDHEELLEETSLLTKELDIYIEENKQLRSQYNALITSYTKIDELYAELTKVDPLKSIITGNASYDIMSKNINLAIAGGWSIFEVLDISAGLSTSFSKTPSSNNVALNLNLRYVFE